MSQNLGTLPIAGGLNTQFQDVPTTGARALLIGNESGLTCVISMEGGGVQKTLYPSTVDWFDIRPGFSGTVRIAPTAVLSSASSYPSSVLMFDVIGPSDPEQPYQYPLALVRNTNVGNTVPLSVQASSLLSTADAAGTVEISLRDSGQVTPSFTVTNDGVMTSIGHLSFDNGGLASDGSGDLTALGYLAPSPPTTKLFGASGGEATMYQFMRGSIKMVWVFYGIFRNGGASNQDFAIPVPFTEFCFIRAANIPPIEMLSGGGVQTINIFSALGATGGTVTAETTVGPYSFGMINSGIDTIRHTPGALATGLLLMEGV